MRHFTCKYVIVEATHYFKFYLYIDENLIVYKLLISILS